MDVERPFIPLVLLTTTVAKGADTQTPVKSNAAAKVSFGIVF